MNVFGALGFRLHGLSGLNNAARSTLSGCSPYLKMPPVPMTILHIEQVLAVLHQ